MLKTIKKIIFQIKKIGRNLPAHSKMLFDYWYLRRKGVETHYGYVTLKGLPLILKSKNSRIILGKGCTLVSKSQHNVAGINHPVILATLQPGAVIEIGGVGISGSAICAAQKISIGDYSGLGVNTKIYDTDFHPIEPMARRNQKSITDAESKEVIIGQDVWIAANAIILKGVNIGDGAVVAAGAVVTSSIPPKTIYGGNPARKIRDL